MNPGLSGVSNLTAEDDDGEFRSPVLLTVP